MTRAEDAVKSLEQFVSDNFEKNVVPWGSEAVTVGFLATVQVLVDVAASLARIADSLEETNRRLEVIWRSMNVYR